MRGVVAGLTVPVTAKIRIFPELERTLAYARMLQAAGVYVLGVHGRTREQKDNTATRANWDAIKVVLGAAGPVVDCPERPVCFCRSTVILPLCQPEVLGASV